MQYELPAANHGAMRDIATPPTDATDRDRAGGVRPVGLLRGMVRDLNAAAVAAGLTTFIWYIFGGLTLQLAVLSEIGLTARQSSSWIFITWLTGGVLSLVLTLSQRQPIPLTWTIPGLVYLGTVAPRFSFAELAAANLVAGIIIVLLAFVGVGQRLMRWIPLPIVMGMFAASILGYMTRLVQATVDDLLVTGATVGGYLLGKALGRQRLPAMGLAVLSGGVAVLIAQRLSPGTLTWSAPNPTVPAMQLSLAAVLTVSLPLVVLALGLGNIQGLGFLLAQGYRVPVNRVSVFVGVGSIVNALFGGHPAAVARIGTAILAGEDAGPAGGRYVANVIASALLLPVAVAAPLVISLLGVLPREYVVALAGLGILSSFQGALEKAFGDTLRFGAVVAFAVAATSFAVAGIPSAFWAILVGCADSFIVERRELLAHWRGASLGT